MSGKGKEVMGEGASKKRKTWKAETSGAETRPVEERGSSLDIKTWRIMAKADPFLKRVDS